MNNDNLQGVVVGGQPINNGILPTDPSLVANGTVASAATNVTPVTPNIIASPVPPVTNDVVSNNNSVNNAVGLGNIPIVNDANIAAAPTNVPVVNASPTVGLVDDSIVSNNNVSQVSATDGIIPVSSSSVVPGIQSSSDTSPVEVSSSPLTFDLPNVTSVDSNANNAFGIVNNSSIGSGTTDNIVVDGGNNGLGMVNDLGTNLSPSIPLNSDSSLNNSFIANGTSDSFTTGINGVTDASSLNVQQNAVIPDNTSTTSVSATNDAQNNNGSDLSTVSLGTYLGHFFLFAIPVVGFIMLIVKAFDKNDKNLSNFAKAYLLFSIIICVVLVVLVVVATILFGNSAVNTVTGVYY